MINAPTVPKYVIFESPGHGWLRVPLSELKKFNILEDISPFSYTDGEFAYLEEDVDMGTFLTARQAVTGEPVDWERDFERQDIEDFPHLPNIIPISSLSKSA